MLFRTFYIIFAFVLAKGYLQLIHERTCYRRIYTGKRLNEKFIRHSLPCNSLEACQHQCSIEKHFDCQGFNIRLDPDKVGRGVCELSSIVSAYLDESRDFNFDPEFSYFERLHNNELPNCGRPNGMRYADFSSYGPTGENRAGPTGSGGPYYGGDSYGPWSTGFGTANHGPWGSHGYGSGYYVSNNPSRGPTPQFRPSGRYLPQSYGSGVEHSFQGRGRHQYAKNLPDWNLNYSPHGSYGGDDRKHEKTHRFPTYIIVDADANKRFGCGNGESGNFNNSCGNNFTSSPKENNDKLESGNNTLSPQDKESDFRNELSPPTNNAPPEPKNLPFPPHDAAMRPHVYPAKPEDLPPKFDAPPNKPFYYDDFVPYRPPDTNFPPIVGREVCFQRIHPGYRLNDGSIRETYDAPSVLDCETLCTGSPFKCTGYSFRYSSSAGGLPNCLLTDFQSIARTSHLLLDRSCDFYFRMDKCLNLERTGDADCFLKVTNNRKFESGKIIKSFNVASISDCELACLSSSSFTCRSFSFRSGASTIGEQEENCLLSDWPVSALTPKDFVYSSHDVYERGSYGHGCELDVGPHVIGPGPPFEDYPLTISGKESWSADETWTHYTVSGWPCKAGTECQLNPVVGFWSCQVEGGDEERWDYCCMPRHSCGYSRGYHYPWCYVGEAGPEQWRPCSEQYYPEFSYRYSYKPVPNHNLHPDDSFGPPKDAGPWNSGGIESLGPSTYWPISYLYDSPPPNETYIWDEQLHDHHHHHHHQSEGHEDNEESPFIRFKTCKHRFPYPKAVVQKLDFTNSSKATDPDEQMLSDRPDGPKKVGYRDAVLPPEANLGFSNFSESGEQNGEINFSPKENSTENKIFHKNDTAFKNIEKTKKSKEVVRKIEKIIEENLKT